MRKLVVQFGLCGLGLCVLSACDRQSSEPDRQASTSVVPGETAGAPASDSNDARGPAAPRSASSTSNSSAVSDVKVELADHAQLLERIEQTKGRVVVVDVWSTSCLPCMKEFPHLVELARRWPEDVVCISMNVDYLGLPKAPPPTVVPKVSEFLKSQAADADNLVNLISSEPDSDVLTKLQIESMPAILVINRAGEQVAKLTTDSAGADGLTYAGDVVPLVEKLVEENNKSNK